MNGRVFQVLVLTGAAASAALVWLTEIPLGVPEEWTWQRVVVEEGQQVDLLLGGLIAVVCGLLYFGCSVLGSSRLERAGSWETAAWLLGLFALGNLWIWSVQAAPPGAKTALKPTWVLYDPGSSGYFFEAAFGMEDAGAFLAGYEERMARGDVLHVGTHPPGLFLFHYGLIELCRSLPGLSQFLLEIQPEATAESFAALEDNFLPAPRLLSDAERAALWLASQLTQFTAVAVVVPLYWLLRRNCSRRGSWQAVAFWPLVPAVAVFLPKSDALYPLVGCLFLWLWLEGVRRRSAVYCVPAGLVFWTGMFLSLAMLPVGLLGLLLSLWECRESSRAAVWPFRQLLVPAAWGTLGFCVPVVLLWLFAGINLLNVWLWNYRNHAAFYEQFQRTWWKWLPVNALELTLAVGVPVMFAAVWSAVRMLRSGGDLLRQRSELWLCPLVWALLWLSGKNMGEAARLWLVIMPWWVWMLGAAFETSTVSEPDSRRHQQSGWHLLLILQMLVCLATVSGVRGFHFGAL